jgi:membrane associated rhomboid family serine protease
VVEAILWKVMSMKGLWQSTVGALTPCVRFLISLLVVVYLASLPGKLAKSYDLYLWLPLTGADFWRGEYWRLVSYPFLPAGFYDLLFNCVVIGWLGSTLERTWGSRQFLTYSFIVVIAAGLAVVIARPLDGSQRLVGLGSLDFGLMAAWAWVNFRGLDFSNFSGQLSMAHVAMVVGAINLVMGCFRGGLANTLIMASGALAGLLYLYIRTKLAARPALAPAPGQKQEEVQSGRISRLEL